MTGTADDGISKPGKKIIMRLGSIRKAQASLTSHDTAAKCNMSTQDGLAQPNPVPPPQLSEDIQTPRQTSAFDKSIPGLRRPNNRYDFTYPLPTHGMQWNMGGLFISDVPDFSGRIASRFPDQVEVLCQYTWHSSHKRLLDGGRLLGWPAIYVPGGAHIWRGVPRGYDLRKVKYKTMILDEHSAEQSSFPYEPTFRALEEAQKQAHTQGSDAPGQPLTEAFNFSGVNLVTDSNVLVQLFDFVSGPTPTTTPYFRLEVSVFDNTLFLHNAERKYGGQVVGRSRVPDTVTGFVDRALFSLGTREPAAPFSGSHWRVVRYRLGTMTCVVRARVDCVCEPDDISHNKAADPLRGMKRQLARTREDNGHIMFRATSAHHVGDRDQVGRPAVLSARHELESAEQRRDRIMPRIWFGRVPILVDTTFSRKMEVKEARVLSMYDHYAAWEQEHQSSLKRLAGLLQRLKEVTQSLGGDCAIIADSFKRAFVFIKQAKSQRMVPGEVYSQFWRGNDQNVNTSRESSTESPMSPLSSISGFTGVVEALGVEAQEPEHGTMSPPQQLQNSNKRRKISQVGLGLSTWIPVESDSSGTDSQSDTKESSSELSEVPSQFNTPDDVAGVYTDEESGYSSSAISDDRTIEMVRHTDTEDEKVRLENEGMDDIVGDEYSGESSAQSCNQSQENSES